MCSGDIPSTIYMCRIHVHTDDITHQTTNRYIYIYMQLGTPDMFIYFKFLSLPYDIQCYKFTGNETITAWQVTGCIFPKLTLNWPDFEIKHLQGDQIIPVGLPKVIALTRAQAHTIRMIQSEKLMLVLYSHNPGGFGLSIIQLVPEMVKPMAPPAEAPEIKEFRHLYPIV